MKKKRIMNIAIVGLGNIGSYLYKFLSANIKQIEKKNTSKNIKIHGGWIIGFLLMVGMMFGSLRPTGDFFLMGG